MDAESDKILSIFQFRLPILDVTRMNGKHEIHSH